MSLNASLSCISTEFRIFSKLTTAGVTPQSQKPSGSDPDPASDSSERASSDSSCSDSDPSEEKKVSMICANGKKTTCCAVF